MLVLASYRSLTNQILIFDILDLNFQSEFQQYAGSSLASSVLLCAIDTSSSLVLLLDPASLLSNVKS